MNAPPATATRDAAFLALVLADALKLGLPDPDYITMSVGGRSAHVSAIDFQFNHRNGQDPLPRLHAWAERFGADVRVSADSEDPRSTWHKFSFTHSGVLFGAYAEIAAAPCPSVAPHTGRQCTLTGDHDKHESGMVVWTDAAVLAASIDSRTPLEVTQ